MKSDRRRRRVRLCWSAISVLVCASFLAAAFLIPRRTTSESILTIDEVWMVHPATALVSQSFLCRLSGTVLDILRGKQDQAIPIKTIRGAYIFGSKQLQRWGLAERKLPASSIVLHRKPTFWQKSESLLITSFAIVTGLQFVVLYLLFKHKQLARARSEQMRLSGLLINAQEDERKHFASELHDDFGQRLALLSLGLETVTEMVPELPTKARLELRELWNLADAIGADLHTMSHRLHSSTLERLGLVPGVEALCEEFTARRGIQAVFSHNNVPHSIPPDISLCLFRVVQESLRNAQKHSGGSKASVVIDQVGGVLHLSIADDGAGFDLENLNRREGLGVLSMQERARLIGSRFEIRSQPHAGTSVHVWVPLLQQGRETPARQQVTTVRSIASITSG